MAKQEGPPGTCRTAITGVQNGEGWANVFWSLLAGGTTANQAALDSWNTAFFNAYTAAWISHILPSASVNAATSTLFQSPGLVLHAVHTGSVAGTASAQPVEDNSSCKVISWLSQVYWRGGKPRTYIPTLGATDTDDSKVLTATQIALLVTAGNQFHTAVNALSATGITQTTHGFVSFKSGGVDRTPPVFFPITGAAVHPRIGSQRGRLGSWKP